MVASQMLALLTYTESASSIVDHAAADNLGSSSTAQMNTCVFNSRFTSCPRMRRAHRVAVARRIPDPIESAPLEHLAGVVLNANAAGPGWPPASPLWR